MEVKPWSISIRSILFAVFLLWPFLLHVLLAEEFPSFGPLVTRESRRTIVSTESGVITAVDVHDRKKGPYHLQFITLDTSSLFLPVLLHTDMVFYVHTGRGIVTWIGEDGANRIDVERGDIYRLEEGAVFYVQSPSDPMREKLRIHAIFNTIGDENPSEAFVGAYSNVSDLVLGFNEKVLQMGFGVSEEVIKGIKEVEKPLSIVHFEPKNEIDESNWKEGIFEALIGGRNPISFINGKKKKKTKTKTKTKTFNFFNRKPDVENCNGWSIAVTNRDFQPLRGSDIGVFMVNLTKGSMMGPHWNPKATEIAIVIHGQGMVQVVCPSNPSGEASATLECQSTSFKVKEGDIFIVPRFHPMAQISFNNDSFVFMGFTTMVNKNHPQFLAGKRSVLRAIDREIMAISFNTANTTVEQFLDSQEESIMLDCTSCAEELERKMEEEIERKRQEAARQREEEEARKREQEEARKREEKEARRKEEQARRREEEEARKREEEEAKRREEEEARKREEAEARRTEEEEAEARRREEEEGRKREEEEARRREEEEEARKREEKEEARREEEEAREQAEAAAAAARKWEEEEARRKKKEEQKEREEEEATRQEEERQRQIQEEEEARRQEEGQRQRKQEEEEARRQGEREKEKEAATKEEEEGESWGGRGKKVRKMWRL